MKSEIRLDDLTKDNIAAFRRINSVVLQTTYSDSWYRQSLDVGQLAKLALYIDTPVGAIRCALEVQGSLPVRIYIMTLAVLAPYRGYGIGRRLVDHIVEQARNLFVHEIYVHVWTENAEGIEWYSKRGFQKKGLVEKYYQKMSPPNDAWIMSLVV